MEERKIEEKSGKKTTQPSQQSGLVKAVGIVLIVIGTIGLIYFLIALRSGILSNSDPDRSTFVMLGVAFGLIFIVPPCLAIFFLGSYILKKKKILLILSLIIIFFILFYLFAILH